MKIPISCAAALFALPLNVPAASWTPLASLAPSGAGVMLLLTDGTVLVEETDHIHWMRLAPDAQGGYIRGDWSKFPASQMATPREYFASQILPSGKLWLLGGEYTGIGLAKNRGGTAEIFDPVANQWSPAAPFPSQTNCPLVGEFGGSLTNGSMMITNIVSTSGWQTGWPLTGSKSGSGIPDGAVISSIDSATQIHISAAATRTANVAMVVGPQSSGSTVNGSNIISGISSTAGFQTLWSISGPGIPANAVITSVDSGSQIHISANATSTGSNVALTFHVQIRPTQCFGDAPSILLQSGKILAGYTSSATTYIYDPATDSWSPGPARVYSDRSDEEGWAKLGDGSVVTYDIFQSNAAGSGYAERFDPVAQRWYGISPGDNTAKGTLPVLSGPSIGNELGPLLRLQDDRMLVIGANGHTALYTPSTNTWAAGPDITGQLGGQPFLFAADDAAAAILPNGHVILAADAGNGIEATGQIAAGSPRITGIPSTTQLQVGWAVTGVGIAAGATIKSIDSPSQVTLTSNATASATETLTFGGVFATPVQLFDFDPSANRIGPVSPAIPDARLLTESASVTRMLVLPTGQLLFADGTSQLWVYTPDGSAPAELRPSVISVTSNGNGSFTLTGLQLSGQSAGAAYGDDVQTDENYPIVSFVTSSGNVAYAKTTNWSYIGVGGGAAPQTVSFTLNPQMTGGVYSLVISAAGITSNPVTVMVSADLSRVTVLPAVTSVQDAESARLSIVPGQWTSIYGYGLSNSARSWSAKDFSSGAAPGSPLPTTLDGVAVTIGGKAAAVYYVSPNLIDVQAPGNLPVGNATVVVSNNGLTSAQFTATIGQSSPSFFFYQAGGSYFPAAVHLSGKVIGDPAISGSVVEPAHPGETIELYAGGLAASEAGVVISPTPFAQPVSVSAGAYSLTVQAAVLVYPGEYQINVQLPANIPPGVHALTLTVPNGSTASAGITVLLPVGP